MGKSFSNDTKQVFVQNKSCLQVQKHKGSNAMVCLDKLACFTLEQKHKIISCLLWTRILLFNFCSMLKIPNLFLVLFLLILKRFQKVFKTFLGCLLSDMKCLLQHYSALDFSWPIKAWHFLFLRWKVVV